MKDLYKILEVDRKASIDVIEKAYKVLAKKYHPDLQSTQESKKVAEEKIKKINEAYEILKDNEKRKKYDLELEQEEKRNTVNNTNYNSDYTNRNHNSSAVNGTTYNNVNYKQNVGYKNNAESNNKQNYQSDSNQNKDINNSNVNNQYSEAQLTDKQRKKLNKKIQRKMQDEYLRAYGDYLTKNGYRVAFRINWRKLPYLLIVVLIIIAIGAFLWYFPVTNRYLVSLYEDNIIIKKIVDMIISLFN